MMYFRTVVRNLRKGRSYGILNIAGLAIGIACASLIFLWVEDELTFDHYFENRSTLYRVMENQSRNGELFTVNVTPGPMAAGIKSEISGIRNATRMSGGVSESLFSAGDKQIYEKGNYTDSSFFSMFHLRFIKGDSRHVFDQLHSVVITESMAARFFGDADPMGQLMKMDADLLLTVTGVVEDLPDNVSLKFDWLAPFDLIVGKFDWMTRWDASGVVTYAEMIAGGDVQDMNKQLRDYLKSKRDNHDLHFFLFAMPDWHLYNHFENGKQTGRGQIKYVKLFAAIASIVLIIACINFMNLATARSEQRAREVGVRKTLGAARKKLIGQFIGESIIMSFMAVGLAVGIIYMVLPAFNSLVEKQLALDLLDPTHIGSLFIIGALTGFLSGSYPAFYLSSFNPVQVLKGLTSGAGGRSASYIRKGLVICQFVVSITLIICTVVIFQQVRHTKERDLGYSKKDVLYLNLHGPLQENFSAVKASLLNTGVVENATLSINPTIQFGWFSTDSFTWNGKDPGNDVLINVESVTPEYLSTMQIKLKEGRDFHAQADTDVDHVIINESLSRQMGEGSQIGNTITQFRRSDPSHNWNMKVVGVVEDFVFGNIYNTTVAPVILICNPAPYNYLTIRLSSGVDLKKSLAKIEAVMRTANPEYPFEYKFLDEEFDALFKTEALIEKLSGLFSTLAILISCLGLFGLATYTTARRTKEIGIRKVLGASVSGVTTLLSADFLKLVAIACFISFPLSWWFMHEWLGSYEYRTPIYWWVFALAGICALGIALLTVGFQTIKAAVVNPAKSLRSE